MAKSLYLELNQMDLEKIYCFNIKVLMFSDLSLIILWQNFNISAKI